MIGAMKVVALVVACSLGCGLTMTRGPEGTPPGQRPQCSETMEAPKRDAYGAGLGFLTILVGILFYKTDGNPELGVPLIVGGSVVTAASYISGGIGYFRVKRCKKAIADFDARQPPAP